MQYPVEDRPDPEYHTLSDAQVAGVIYEAYRKIWSAHGRPDRITWESLHEGDRAKLAGFVAHVRAGGAWPKPPTRRREDGTSEPLSDLQLLLIRVSGAIVAALTDGAPSADQRALGAGDPSRQGCEFCAGPRDHSTTGGICPELDRRSGVTRRSPEDDTKPEIPSAKG